MRAFLLSFILILAGGLFAHVAFAQSEIVYKPMVTLPRLNPNSQSTEAYIQALFFLSISLGAILAFIKILLGGIKWMLADTNASSIGAAKTDIKGAIFGLLIILASVLILNTINPNLTRLNVFVNAPSLENARATVQGNTATVDTSKSYFRSRTVGSAEGLQAYKNSCAAAGKQIVESGNGVARTYRCQ